MLNVSPNSGQANSAVTGGTRKNRLDALEAAAGRKLGAVERNQLGETQHQALRWTYLGSGMTHPKFVATLAAIYSAARDRIAAVASAFC